MSPRSADTRRLVGRYRLDSELGRGAMGTVWSAYDEVLHRPVAVKEVRLSLVPVSERAIVRERTLREARATAMLSHPNVVTLYDVVEVDSEPYVVMELLPSRSLAAYIGERGTLSHAETAEIGSAVASALMTAHRAGITHRDVKPGNVLIGTDGQIKLTDFGIARNAAESSMTQTGTVLGSPPYIAPEVAMGRTVGPPADLWGLGATLFACLEGRPPYDAGDPVSTVSAVVHGDIPRPTGRGPVVDVVRGLMVKDPGLRMPLPAVRRRLRPLMADPEGPMLSAPPAPATTEFRLPQTPAPNSDDPRSGLIPVVGRSGTLVEGADPSGERPPSPGQGAPGADGSGSSSGSPAPGRPMPAQPAPRTAPISGTAAAPPAAGSSDDAEAVAAAPAEAPPTGAPSTEAPEEAGDAADGADAAAAGGAVAGSAAVGAAAAGAVAGTASGTDTAGPGTTAPDAGSDDAAGTDDADAPSSSDDEQDDARSTPDGGAAPDEADAPAEDGPGSSAEADDGAPDAAPDEAESSAAKDATRDTDEPSAGSAAVAVAPSTDAADDTDASAGDEPATGADDEAAKGAAAAEGGSSAGGSSDGAPDGDGDAGGPAVATGLAGAAVGGAAVGAAISVTDEDSDDAAPDADGTPAADDAEPPENGAASPRSSTSGTDRATSAAASDGKGDGEGEGDGDAPTGKDAVTPPGTPRTATPSSGTPRTATPSSGTPRTTTPSSGTPRPGAPSPGSRTPTPPSGNPSVPEPSAAETTMVTPRVPDAARPGPRPGGPSTPGPWSQPYQRPPRAPVAAPRRPGSPQALASDPGPLPFAPSREAAATPSRMWRVGIVALVVVLALAGLVGGYAVVRILGGQPPFSVSLAPVGPVVDGERMVSHSDDNARYSGTGMGFTALVPSTWQQFRLQQPAGDIVVRYVSDDAERELRIDRLVRFYPAQRAAAYAQLLADPARLGADAVRVEPLTVVAPPRAGSEEPVQQTVYRARAGADDDRTTWTRLIPSGADLWVVRMTAPSTAPGGAPAQFAVVADSFTPPV